MEAFLPISNEIDYVQYLHQFSASLPEQFSIEYLESFTRLVRVKITDRSNAYDSLQKLEKAIRKYAVANKFPWINLTGKYTHEQHRSREKPLHSNPIKFTKSDLP
jgi:hypothetical protein